MSEGKEGNGGGTAVMHRADETAGRLSALGGGAEEFAVSQRIAAALAASTIMPEHYRNNLPNVLVAMEYAHRLGCSVLAVAQNLYLIKGKPSLSATFLIGTVNASKRFTPIRFRWVGTEGKDDWGCRAVAQDRESGEECIGPLISIKLAKAEGWFSKKDKNGNETSKWQTFPELMLMYRSAAWWTRVFAPELSLGLHTTDEMEDFGAPQVPSRAQTVVAALDAPDADPVVGALPPGEPPKPAPEDDGSPATAGQLKMAKELRQKARDADLLEADDEEAIEGAIAAKNGPEVRRYINDLSKSLIVPGGAQTGLGV